MKDRKHDEHAKDPAWQVPVSVPGVAKGAYDETYEAGQGSVHEDSGPVGTAKAARTLLPHAEHSADPAGKALEHVTPQVRKLATQRDRSG